MLHFSKKKGLQCLPPSHAPMGPVHQAPHHLGWSAYSPPEISETYKGSTRPLTADRSLESRCSTLSWNTTDH